MTELQAAPPAPSHMPLEPIGWRLHEIPRLFDVSEPYLLDRMRCRSLPFVRVGDAPNSPVVILRDDLSVLNGATPRGIIQIRSLGADRRFFGLTEVWKALTISQPTLWRLIQSGSMPVHREGGHTVIMPADLRDWIRARRTPCRWEPQQ